MATIGNQVTVSFSQFNKKLDGKVDTGATISSLHAEDIAADEDSNRVRFSSPALSDNLITLPLVGVQAVVSADGGQTQRYTVKLDIVVDGVDLPGAIFNLNDRSNMDDDILIGQNVLKAGDFTIDVSQDDPSENQQKESVEESMADETEATRALLGAMETLTGMSIRGCKFSVEENDDDTDEVKEAKKVLAESELDLAKVLCLLKTVAVNKIEYT